MKRFLLPALLAFVGLILLVTGSRVGGPVYRTKADPRAALLSHDTVPAIEQSGDSTVYRFETTRKLFADPVLSIIGLLLLVGAGYYGYRQQLAPRTTTDSTAKGWRCPNCGTLNDATARTCKQCNMGEQAWR